MSTYTVTFRQARCVLRTTVEAVSREAAALAVWQDNMKYRFIISVQEVA